MIRKSKFKLSSGSVLVFTLIIMFVMLVMGLGIIATTVTERKSSLSTEKSIASYQMADTGAEKVLQAIKDHSSGDLNSLGFSCSGGTISGSAGLGNYGVTFYDSVGPINNCSASVSTVKEIKSVGTYANTSRAVQVTVPLDPYTKLLLHFDDAANFLKNYSSGTQVITANGSVIQSSAHAFSSGKSAYFNNGSGAFLSIPDSSDWNFGIGDFTVDFWYKPDVIDPVGYKLLMGTYKNGVYKNWEVMLQAGLLNCAANTDGSLSWNVSITDSTPLVVGNWYHIAFVRNGNSWTCYKNGSSIGTKANSGTINYASEPLEIPDSYSSYNASGNFDEVRISKGVARWTSNFTPPTAPY